MLLFSDLLTKSCDHSQRRLRSGILTLGGVILSLGAVAGAAVADDITFTTDITGANVTIDVGNTQTYDFVVNPGHVVNNIIGDFEIKSGTSASQDILFSVYDTFNGTGH